MNEKTAPLAARLKAAKRFESNNAFEMEFWLLAGNALHKGDTKPFVDLLRRLTTATTNDEGGRVQLLTQAVDNLAAAFEVGLAQFVKEKKNGRKIGSPRIRSLLMAQNIYTKLRNQGTIFPIDGIPMKQKLPVAKALQIAVAETNAYAARIGKPLKYSRITVDQLRKAAAGKDRNFTIARKR